MQQWQYIMQKLICMKAMKKGCSKFPLLLTKISIYMYKTCQITTVLIIEYSVRKVIFDENKHFKSFSLYICAY